MLEMPVDSRVNFAISPDYASTCLRSVFERSSSHVRRLETIIGAAGFTCEGGTMGSSIRF